MAAREPCYSGNLGRTRMHGTMPVLDRVLVHLCSGEFSMEGHRFGCADPRLRRANATSGQMDLAEEGETTASTKSGTNFARPKRTGEIQVQISAAWLRGSFSIAAHPDEPIGHLQARIGPLFGISPAQQWFGTRADTRPRGRQSPLIEVSEEEAAGTLQAVGARHGTHFHLGWQTDGGRPAPLLSPGCMARGLPAVVSSPEDALAAVKVDGACILQWNFQHTESSVGEVRAAAATIGRKIFGEQLALQKAPIGVNDQSRIRKPRGADGTREYGDLLPDYVVLMPDRLPAAGGHFYLVDGYGLLAGLKPTDYGAAFDVPMVPADPSAVGRGEPAVGDGSNEWIPPRRAGWKSPIAKRVAGSGRIMLRPPVEGNATNRPNRDQPDPSLAATAPHLMQAGQKMIEAWRRAVTEAGRWGIRFELQPGQALILDNYRMAYGEEPHYGSAPGTIDYSGRRGDGRMQSKADTRLHWRVYCWTTHRKYRALPVACACMCSPKGRCTLTGKRRDDPSCPHCPQINVQEKLARAGELYDGNNGAGHTVVRPSGKIVYKLDSK